MPQRKRLIAPLLLFQYRGATGRRVRTEFLRRAARMIIERKF